MHLKLRKVVGLNSVPHEIMSHGQNFTDRPGQNFIIKYCPLLCKSVPWKDILI